MHAYSVVHPRVLHQAAAWCRRRPRSNSRARTAPQPPPSTRNLSNRPFRQLCRHQAPRSLIPTENQRASWPRESPRRRPRHHPRRWPRRQRRSAFRSAYRWPRDRRKPPVLSASSRAARRRAAAPTCTRTAPSNTRRPLAPPNARCAAWALSHRGSTRGRLMTRTGEGRSSPANARGSEQPPSAPPTSSGRVSSRLAPPTSCCATTGTLRRRAGQARPRCGPSVSTLWC